MDLLKQLAASVFRLQELAFGATFCLQFLFHSFFFFELRRRLCLSLNVYSLLQICTASYPRDVTVRKHGFETQNISCIVLIFIGTQKSVWTQFIYLEFFCPYTDQDSSVGIVTVYGLDGPGMEPVEDEIFYIHPERPWSPLNLSYNGYRVLSRR